MPAMTLPKKVVKACLMSIALVLFVLHVHGVVVKYIEGRTNFSTKETGPEGVKFPTYTICPSHRFQEDKIEHYNITSGFSLLDTNNQQLYNKSVWEVFQNVTYVLNRDFNITVSRDDRYDGNYLKVGNNNVIDENQEWGTYTVIVYELYTVQAGICYSIAVQEKARKETMMVIRLIYNDNIVPFEYMNGYLSSETDISGVTLSTWYGAKPFIFKTAMGSTLQVLFKKEQWERLSPCDRYKNGNSPSTCFAKAYVDMLLSLSLHKKYNCNITCQIVQMKSVFDLTRHDVPKCHLISDYNCNLMAAYDPPSIEHCKEPCTSTQFLADITEIPGLGSKRRLTVWMLLASEIVTIHEEYLVYDFLSFVGSFGGSLGLFVGFSFYDFGSMLTNIVFAKLTKE